MADQTPETPISAPEPPLGMFSARMDDKGRIKLPVAFQTYFAALEVKKLYVTSLDGYIGQIYPISDWKRKRKLLAESQEDPEIVADMIFNGDDLGGEAEIDASGRITVNTRMREELKLVDGELQLLEVNGRVDILSETVMAERRRQARPAADESGRRKATIQMRMLQQKGLL